MCSAFASSVLTIDSLKVLAPQLHAICTPLYQLVVLTRFNTLETYTEELQKHSAHVFQPTQQDGKHTFTKRHSKDNTGRIRSLFLKYLSQPPTGDKYYPKRLH